jgi:hypothetical protein
MFTPDCSVSLNLGAECKKVRESIRPSELLSTPLPSLSVPHRLHHIRVATAQGPERTTESLLPGKLLSLRRHGLHVLGFRIHVIKISQTQKKPDESSPLRSPFDSTKRCRTPCICFSPWNKKFSEERRRTVRWFQAAGQPPALASSFLRLACRTPSKL